MFFFPEGPLTKIQNSGGLFSPIPSRSVNAPSIMSKPSMCQCPQCIKAPSNASMPADWWFYPGGPCPKTQDSSTFVIYRCAEPPARVPRIEFILELLTERLMSPASLNCLPWRDRAVGRQRLHQILMFINLLRTIPDIKPMLRERGE